MRPEGDGWTTSQQKLLLRAALLHGDRAIAAWHDWKRGIIVDRLDRGSLRLLPLLYHNLRRHGISDPDMAQFLEIYRVTWLNNQGLLHDLAAILQILQQREIPTMILKGMAMALLYYKDLGIRPMNDLDILIKPEHALDAIDVLTNAGWTLMMERELPLTKADIAVMKAVAFKSASGRELDLHWHIFPEQMAPGADIPFWEGAIEIMVMGTPTTVMNHADLLLHVCAHGTNISSNAILRMLADVYMILTKTEGEIVWHRLVTQARESHLVLSVRTALSCLRDLLEVSVPETTQENLDMVPVSMIDRLTYYAITNRPTRISGPFLLLLKLALNYVSLTKSMSSTARLLGLPEFLKQRWQLSHKWKVPFVAVEKTFVHFLKGSKQ